MKQEPPARIQQLAEVDQSLSELRCCVDDIGRYDEVVLSPANPCSSGSLLMSNLRYSMLRSSLKFLLCRHEEV